MALERTLRAVIAYKLARAIASVLAAATLVALVLTHVTVAAERLAQEAHDHAATRLGLAVSGLLADALEPAHVDVVLVALALDAAMLFVEAWALWRDHAWAPWFVAATSGVLVPFELESLVKHGGVGRAALLGLNLAIVAYLLARTWRRHHRRAA